MLSHRSWIGGGRGLSLMQKWRGKFPNNFWTCFRNLNSAKPHSLWLAEKLQQAKQRPLLTDIIYEDRLAAQWKACVSGHSLCGFPCNLVLNFTPSNNRKHRKRECLWARCPTSPGTCAPGHHSKPQHSGTEGHCFVQSSESVFHEINKSCSFSENQFCTGFVQGNAAPQWETKSSWIPKSGRNKAKLLGAKQKNDPANRKNCQSPRYKYWKHRENISPSKDTGSCQHSINIYWIKE